MANPPAGHLGPQNWRVKGPPGLHVCSSLLPLGLVEGLLHPGWFSASRARRLVEGLLHPGWSSASRAHGLVEGLLDPGWSSASRALGLVEGLLHPVWFSVSTAVPALTHLLAASSGISGKGRGSGDFCCFSWEQRSIPTHSRGGRPGRRTVIGMVTPGVLTSCVLPKKPAPGGCWPGERRAPGPMAGCPHGPRKASWLVSSRTFPRPASPPWTFPALKTCLIPESRRPLRGPAVCAGPPSALRLSSFHL